MKLLLCSFVWTCTITFLFGQDLLITGVIDVPLSRGTPKAVELVALNDISDLSKHGFCSANNGGGSDGEEFTFPAVTVSKGTFIYIATESPQFNAFFGFNPDYTDSAANVNGDDSVELFFNGVVVDVFGDINTRGTGEPWEYLDGWAYRKDNISHTTTFNSSQWAFCGINALDNETTNASATTKFPLESFDINTLSADNINTTIKIFPNPADKLIQIEGLNAVASVAIYAQTGQRVLTQAVDKTVDVSSLIPGIYLVEISHRERVRFHKLIKK